MAAQKGKDLLLKMHDGAGFVTVAGLRSRRIAFNAGDGRRYPRRVDRAMARATGGRRRQARVGVGKGLFKDAVSDAMVRQAFFDGVLKTCQVIVPDFGAIEGLFQISSLDFPVSITAR
jgi:predicted secreted protein